jgi:hypothetical protein
MTKVACSLLYAESRPNIYIYIYTHKSMIVIQIYTQKHDCNWGTGWGRRIGKENDGGNTAAIHCVYIKVAQGNSLRAVVK